MNMMTNNSDHHQDDYMINNNNNNNNNNKGIMMQMFPRSKTPTIINYSRTHGGDHDDDIDIVEACNNKAGGGEAITIAAASGKKKAGSDKNKCPKPKYAFQTRSQVDILDDGYRWRKYGQKAVKNNKFPRSYYRCTHQGCNVKKQIERLWKDESIVVTTYEGMHSHPIDKSTDNFEHILTQMQIYTS